MNKAIKEWRNLELSQEYILFEEQSFADLKGIAAVVNLMISEIEKLEADKKELIDTLEAMADGMNGLEAYALARRVVAKFRVKKDYKRRSET